METTTRVCPHCGEPPGAGVFCAACGRSLADVERLPTRAEWEAAGGGAPAAGGAAVAPAAPPPAGAGDATAFLAAMHAAGDPGAETFPAAAPRIFRRTPTLRGWVVRPVDREDFERPRRYVPGIVLAVDGRFVQLDSELRGWGQRNFPYYHHTVSPEPVDPPPAGELEAALAALRRAHGVS